MKMRRKQPQRFISKEVMKRRKKSQNRARTKVCRRRNERVLYCEYCHRFASGGYLIYSHTLDNTKICGACYQYERKHNKIVPVSQRGNNRKFNRKGKKHCKKTKCENCGDRCQELFRAGTAKLDICGKCAGHEIETGTLKKRIKVELVFKGPNPNRKRIPHEIKKKLSPSHKIKLPTERRLGAKRSSISSSSFSSPLPTILLPCTNKISKTSSSSLPHIIDRKILSPSSFPNNIHHFHITNEPTMPLLGKENNVPPLTIVNSNVSTNFTPSSHVVSISSSSSAKARMATKTTARRSNTSYLKRKLLNEFDQPKAKRRAISLRSSIKLLGDVIDEEKINEDINNKGSQEDDDKVKKSSIVFVPTTNLTSTSANRIIDQKNFVQKNETLKTITNHMPSTILNISNLNKNKFMAAVGKKNDENGAALMAMSSSFTVASSCSPESGTNAEIRTIPAFAPVKSTSSIAQKRNTRITIKLSFRRRRSRRARHQVVPEYQFSGIATKTKELTSN